MSYSHSTSTMQTRISPLSARLSSRQAKPTAWKHAHQQDALRASEHPSWKRRLDLLCICLAMPVLVLLMMFIAGVIKLVSPGPVFFKQARVGHRLTPFLCLKFRTMKVGADDQAHRRHVEQLIRSNARMTKLDRLGDSRLIPGGALLRATGLDELPQVFNVWRGEMSLVGPRPCTIYELENFRPEQYTRFDSLPGLTGLWQVRGKNRTTFNEMVELDIHYVRTKSLWFDLKILSETFSAVAEQVASSYRERPASAPMVG